MEHGHGKAKEMWKDPRCAFLTELRMCSCRHGSHCCTLAWNSEHSSGHFCSRKVNAKRNGCGHGSQCAKGLFNPPQVTQRGKLLPARGEERLQLGVPRPAAALCSARRTGAVDARGLSGSAGHASSRDAGPTETHVICRLCCQASLPLGTVSFWFGGLRGLGVGYSGSRGAGLLEPQRNQRCAQDSVVGMSLR